MYEHVELTQGLYVPFQETSGDSNTWKIVLVLIFHIEQWLQKRTAGRILKKTALVWDARGISAASAYGRDRYISLEFEEDACTALTHSSFRGFS